MTARTPKLVKTELAEIPGVVTDLSGKRHVCTTCGASGPVETNLTHSSWCPQDEALAAKRHACTRCGASAPNGAQLTHSSWCPNR